MIFDRVQGDIDTAILLRTRLQNGETLTDVEIQQLEKGTLTYNTLNRIENKQSQLKKLLSQMGYYCPEVINVTWNEYQFFKQADFDRILVNMQILIEAFFVYSDTPKMPENNYRKYQVINDTEKILYDLDVMINDVKSHYRECGNFECGVE
jgi:hypothetical protein